MIELLSDPAFIILAITVLIQLIVLLPVYFHFVTYKNPSDNTTVSTPVSVLITAKNEEDNLRHFLPSLIEQKYPEFEVIVVNDQSVDNTYEVLREMAEKYDKLRIVNVEEHIRKYPGKKFAITLGIKKAQFDYILFTDADCKPVSDNWIRSMMKNYTDDIEIVIGFSPYIIRKSLLNIFIQMDTIYSALLYLSSAIRKKTYMGVGRNMSYTKSLFFKSGFSSQLHVPFGDDDLFINRNSTLENVAIEIGHDSFVETVPENRWKHWIKQKIRHLSAGSEYKKKDKNRLTIIWLTHFIFYSAFIIAVILSPQNMFVWILFGFRSILFLILYGLVLNKLQRLYMLFFIPFIEVIYHLIIIPYLSLISLVRKNKNIW